MEELIKSIVDNFQILTIKGNEIKGQCRCDISLTDPYTDWKGEVYLTDEQMKEPGHLLHAIKKLKYLVDNKIQSHNKIK